MIRFKYKISEALSGLIHDTIPDYEEDYLYGMLAEGDAGQLKHKSLFLICEELNSGSTSILINPVAVVAKNTFDAVEMYCEDLEKESAVSVAELESRCDALKVESI